MMNNSSTVPVIAIVLELIDCLLFPPLAAVGLIALLARLALAQRNGDADIRMQQNHNRKAYLDEIKEGAKAVKKRPILVESVVVGAEEAQIA